MEAIESADQLALREELGDVLMQPVFHARVAAERDDGTGYTIDEVIDGIVAKLVRRHPHVFGDVTVSGAEEVKANWDEIKKKEKADLVVPSPSPGGRTVHFRIAFASGPVLTLPRYGRDLIQSARG